MACHLIIFALLKKTVKWHANPFINRKTMYNYPSDKEYKCMSTPPTLCFSISICPRPLIQMTLSNRAPFQLQRRKRELSTILQIPSLSLLPLNSLKQTLEIARSEPVKFVPLNNLNEHSGAIHQRLREQLQEISTFVEINQDV